MGYSYFTVDTSVWLDGVTFTKTARANAEEKTGTFKEFMETPKTVETPVVKTAALSVAGTEAPAGVQELPAYLADVEDLTPFIISADNKPGERFEAELKRTAFSEDKTAAAKTSSPYNMSEQTAKAREQKQRTLKGPGDAKVFAMDSVKRYTDMRARPAFAPSQAPETAKDSQKIKLQRLKDSIKAQETAPAEKTAFAPVDVAAVRAQASADVGYKRDSMPSVSSEKTSAAAAWFPEAMTRTLDMYEAMNKVAAQSAAAPSKDLSV